MVATSEALFTRRVHWTRPLAATVVVAGAATMLALVSPSETSLFPPCPFHALTGLWCPGCGTLRGLHQLLTGHPAAAFARNPLMVMALPLLVWSLVAMWRGALGIAARPRMALPVAVPWLVFGVVVAFGVLRNIPVAPFSSLAP